MLWAQNQRLVKPDMYQMALPHNQSDMLGAHNQAKAHNLHRTFTQTT
jgi:hypothetical protein